MVIIVFHIGPIPLIRRILRVPRIPLPRIPDGFARHASHCALQDVVGRAGKLLRVPDVYLTSSSSCSHPFLPVQEDALLHPGAQVLLPGDPVVAGRGAAGGAGPPGGREAGGGPQPGQPGRTRWVHWTHHTHTRTNTGRQAGRHANRHAHAHSHMHVRMQARAPTHPHTSMQAHAHTHRPQPATR